MEISVYPKEFSKAFSNLLEKANITCYQVNQYTHLDQAYLSRLRNGKMKNPSREVVLLISYAFIHYNKDLRLMDIDNLFKSAGYSFYTKKIKFFVTMMKILQTQITVINSFTCL